MKLPAVAIVAAFAGGILLGLVPVRAFHAAHSSLPACLALAIFSLLITGICLACARLSLASAAIVLCGVGGAGDFWLACWRTAASCGACIVAICGAQIPQKTPLRWHGVLLR